MSTARGYREVQAQDIKPGDELLTKFYDADGAYQETDVPVTAVRVFARKVRLTYGEGWGSATVPADKIFAVKES